LNVELLSVMSQYRGASLTSDLARIERYKLPYTQVANGRFAAGPLHAELAEAYESKDDEAIGRLLRFPACCRTFFEQTWGSGGQDTVWEMSEPDIENGIMNVAGPVECNILGRWIGIRWVPHLPCSFGCQHTVAAGKAYRKLMRDLDPMSADVIDEVLSWPIEWSALHGLAEIKYPVVKAISATTYTSVKRTVQRVGSRYPEEGAKGIVFPYTGVPTVHKMQLRKPLYTENGFATAEAMERGHRMVVDAVKAAPAELILDLGCGNGMLMDRLSNALDVPAWGIEVDASKVHGHPRIVVGDLRDIDSLTKGHALHTIIVSQRRFEEVPGLEEWCRYMPRVVVYSYDEPMFARDL
jgi:hypothetical protein